MDLTLNATSDNGQGISLYSSSPNVEVNGVTMNVGARGISFKQNDYAENAHLTLNSSKIHNSRITDGDYDHKTVIGDTRGISLFDVKSSTIDIINSEIFGFGYTVNLAGTLVNNERNYDGTVINVTNSKLMGWTAFNVWSSNTIFNITNSYLKGINTSSGTTNGFATIVVNDDIYGNGWGSANANVFTIKGGTITNYRSGSSTEQLFRVDNQGITKVNFENTLRDSRVIMFLSLMARGIPMRCFILAMKRPLMIGVPT